MKLGKKLIIYTDGSYYDKKNGWAFKILYNIDNSPWILGYGSNKSNNSGQSEIQACIEALEYIQKNCTDYIDKIEAIEIRSDFSKLVKFINNFNKPYFEKTLMEKNYTCHAYDFLILFNSMKKLHLKIKAKKVNGKDYNLLEVHKIANKALKDIPTDDIQLYIKTCENETEKIIEKTNTEITNNEYNQLPKDEKLKWFENTTNKIVNIPTEQVHIEEEIHLNARIVNLDKNFIKAKEKGSIDIPIAVSKSGEKYVLIAGFNRLCIAKILGIKTIPAIIYEDETHIEFLLKHIV